MQGVWNKKNSKLQRSRGHHEVELFYNFITNKLQIEGDTKTKLKHCPSSVNWPRLLETKKAPLFLFNGSTKKVSKLCYHEKTTKSIRNVGATTKIVIPFSRNFQMKPTTTQGRIFTTCSGRSGFCDGTVS